MTSETQVQSRRAIEALRAGVPNQDAVRGTRQLTAVLGTEIQATTEDCRGRFLTG